MDEMASYFSCPSQSPPYRYCQVHPGLEKRPFFKASVWDILHNEKTVPEGFSELLFKQGVRGVQHFLNDNWQRAERISLRCLMASVQQSLIIQQISIRNKLVFWSSQ